MSLLHAVAHPALPERAIFLANRSKDPRMLRYRFGDAREPTVLEEARSTTKERAEWD